MDKSREQAIDDGANVSTGGVNFNYVDTNKLDRMGIGRYNTKKKDGNNFIRIVAPSSTGPFAREIWKHDNVGANNATFLCLDKMFGKACPICDQIAELKASGADNDTIKELNPSRRFLLFVVDTTSRETEEEGPKWFDCPISIYKAVCTLSKDKRTGEKLDPTDPDNGRDVEFVRNDGKRTEYTGYVLRETKPIPSSWYKDLPSFDEVLLVPNPTEMREAVLGRKSDSKDSRSRDREDNRGVENSDENRRSRRDESRSRDDSRNSTRDDSRDDSRSSRGDSRGRDDSNDEDQAAAVRQKLDEIRSRKRERPEEE